MSDEYEQRMKGTDKLKAYVKKGKVNYASRILTMGTNYENSAEGAKIEYENAGFGPNVTASYKSAWERMPANYRAKITSGIEEKWARKYLARMSQ